MDTFINSAAFGPLWTSKLLREDTLILKGTYSQRYIIERAFTRILQEMRFSMRFCKITYMNYMADRSTHQQNALRNRKLQEKEQCLYPVQQLPHHLRSQFMETEAWHSAETTSAHTGYKYIMIFTINSKFMPMIVNPHVAFLESRLFFLDYKS